MRIYGVFRSFVGGKQNMQNFLGVIWAVGLRVHVTGATLIEPQGAKELRGEGGERITSKAQPTILVLMTFIRCVDEPGDPWARFSMLSRLVSAPYLWRCCV